MKKTSVSVASAALSLSNLPVDTPFLVRLTLLTRSLRSRPRGGCTCACRKGPCRMSLWASSLSAVVFPKVQMMLWTRPIASSRQED